MVQISSFASFVGLLSLAAMSEGKFSGSHRNIASLERRSPVTPTAPAPGAIFKSGEQCTMQWDAGTSNAWKTMTIDLMTGDNLSMIKLTSVAQGIDGTSETSHSWTCPEVSPNAPIYFYQFTTASGGSPTWTGRFTIASDSGNVVSAPNATQPGTGAAIPWGIGQLTSSSSSSNNGNSESSSQTTGSSTSSTGSTNSEEDTSSSTASTSSTSSSASSAQTSSSSSSSSKSGATSMNQIQIGAIMSSVAFVIGALLV